MSQAPQAFVRPIADVAPVPCPCGQSIRIIGAKDAAVCSFHVTTIGDSVRHYHRHTVETYHILEGTGIMELDAEEIVVRPGDTVYIPIGVRHRLRTTGEVRTIVVGVPAFDPADEFFD